jgi:hypothetical protein
MIFVLNRILAVGEKCTAAHNRMFERWRQENFFKYMREEFLLDALVDYQIEPEDPTRTIPNPERKALDNEIQAARAEVAKLDANWEPRPQPMQNSADRPCAASRLPTANSASSCAMSARS